jgi:hypothetical protein
MPTAFDCIWTDGAADGNWTTAGNWTGGTPLTTELAILGDSSRDIVTGVDQTAVNDIQLHVTKGFTGTLGTQAAAWKTGNAAGSLCYINSLGSNSINLAHVGCTRLEVEGTMRIPHALYLAGGTYTAVHVIFGDVTIAAGCTVTNLYLHGSGARVLAQSGALLSTKCDVHAGKLTLKATAATINNYGGTTDVAGTGAQGNTTAINCFGGLVLLNAPGGTHTKINAYSGRVDGRSEGNAYTVTDADVWSGATYDVTGSSIAETNVPTVYGTGRYIGPSSPTAAYSSSATSKARGCTGYRSFG